MKTSSTAIENRIMSAMRAAGERFKTRDDYLSYALDAADKVKADEQAALSELSDLLQQGLDAPDSAFKAFPTSEELELRYQKKYGRES